MNNIDFNKITCFTAHEECNKACNKKSCRFWHDMNNESNNCIINKVNNITEDLTLQDIGDIFGITRMRICQIEKQTLKKLSKKSLLS